MTLTDRVGLLKFFYNLGKEYADVLKGTLTPTLLAGYMANQAGATATASTGMALLVPLAMIVVSLVAGYATWKWRIVHATIGHEWEANPFQRAQIDTLREIRDRLPVPTTCVTGKVHVFSNGHTVPHHESVSNHEATR